MGAMWSTRTVPQGEFDRLSAAYDRQISDQIALHNLHFEQKRSLELATNRESLGWEIMAVSTVTAALVMTASALKNKLMAVPIIILVMGIGYRYDRCYGEHASDIKECAERLLEEDRRRFEMIGGPITLDEIDARVRSKREHSRLDRSSGDVTSN
uniref:SMODS and SLOG-associating 2TM effector domain-containing protein n=1 Tax=Parascaris univalens TaxID=6257 RepID=A0A915ALE9_PARUN